MPLSEENSTLKYLQIDRLGVIFVITALSLSVIIYFFSFSPFSVFINPFHQYLINGLDFYKIRCDGLSHFSINECKNYSNSFFFYLIIFVTNSFLYSFLYIYSIKREKYINSINYSDRNTFILAIIVKFLLFYFLFVDNIDFLDRYMGMKVVFFGFIFSILTMLLGYWFCCLFFDIIHLSYQAFLYD